MIYNEVLNIYTYIIILAIIYYLISKNKSAILLSIIIIIIIFYYVNNTIKESNDKNAQGLVKKAEIIKSEVQDIVEVNTNNFYINKNDKNAKFLIKNTEFMDILFNIRFIKRFDKTRYSNMIINMDKLMKIYIYIYWRIDTI